jgi:hypothetical protein
MRDAFAAYDLLRQACEPPFSNCRFLHPRQSQLPYLFRNQLRFIPIMRRLSEIDFAIAFMFAACRHPSSLTNVVIDKAFPSLIC